jgi:putative oxidoreductase
MEAFDWAMLVLRVWVAVVITSHGVNHARSLEGTASWFGKVGFRSPALQARASAVTEIGVGALLMVGLLTPLAAAGVIATMFVAFWSIHRHNGFFIFRPGEGYEYVVTLAVAALAIAITGAGSVSLDRALGIGVDLDGWVGFALALGGLAAGAAQLTMFWRRPVAAPQPATSKGT